MLKHNLQELPLGFAIGIIAVAVGIIVTFALAAAAKLAEDAAKNPKARRAIHLFVILDWALGAIVLLTSWLLKI